MLKTTDPPSKLHLSSGSALVVSDLLIAAGRVPNIEKLALTEAGIKYNEFGVIVDRNLQTTNRSVYAIGDIVDGPSFTHTASYHAAIVLKKTLFGLSSTIQTTHIPQVTYTDPEIASVGLNFNDAVKRFGNKVERSSVNLKSNDRAITDSKTEGFVEVVLFGRKVIGCTIVSKNAGELISFWAFIISRNLKISNVNSMVPPYPTLGEVNKRVVSEYYAPKLFGNSFLKFYVKIFQKIFK